MQSETKVSRNELLVALYQTTSKQELLKQFEENIKTSKRKKDDKYIHLLEQIIYFSHAIIYDHSIQTAHNYRQSFMSVAKASKMLSDEDVEKAFSFLNRTEKKAIKAPKEPKLEDMVTIKTKCEGKDAISKLKKELDDKKYTVSKGQKSEDKELYIKVALVTLSTGESLKSIVDTLTIDSKKIVLKLEKKTIKTYIKDIREYYEDKRGTDYPRAVRKAIKSMDIENCVNLKDLARMYENCMSK